MPNSIQVSVVVPTFRRPELLHRCLDALMAQTLDTSLYEVIVADDAESAATWRVVQAWREKSEKPLLRYMPVTDVHGPAAARNAGWRAARGEIIAFTDDDCIPAQDWLSAALTAICDPAIDGVSGRIIVPLPAVATDYERSVAGLEHAPFATANCLYRRDALLSVGGFDERYTTAWREDSDLHFSLLQQGRRCISHPQAVVIHPVRPASWGVSLRLQRNNLFNALLYKKHPALYRDLIQARPPWRYYGMTGTLISGLGASFTGPLWLGQLMMAVWMGWTAYFFVQRLARTAHYPSHVLEMLITSALIPPLAVFWRLRGAVKYRVVFL